MQTIINSELIRIKLFQWLTDKKIHAASTGNSFTQLLEEGEISGDEFAFQIEFNSSLVRAKFNSEQYQVNFESTSLEEMQQWYVLLAIDKNKQHILFMVDPTDEDAFNYFQLQVNAPINIHLISYQEWKLAIHHSHAQRDKQYHTSDINLSNTSITYTDKVNQIVNHILQYGLTAKASDIHFEPDSLGYQIRMRIDGLLHITQNFSYKESIPLITRIKALAKLDINEKRQPQDGSFEIMLGQKQYAYRLSTCSTIQGEKLVIRILEKQQLTEITQLGLNEQHYQLFTEAINKSQGLVLVCGPTGSGKTSTLYSALKYRHVPTVNIISIEDPIEMQITGINQIQINHKIDLNFQTILRSVLRQDPDIIMIGEIRDGETADIAIKAAQTGHLVFSTIHTQSAIKCFNRLIGMGISKYDLIESLNLIVSQRLLRKLCQHCKQEHILDTKEKFFPLLCESKIYQANTCHLCHKGYLGRFAIYEMIPFFNQEMNNLNALKKMKQWYQANVKESIEHQAIQAIKLGLTSLAEAKRVVL